VQFSHYDAEQKNFVPQEELIQRLQEENRQLRMANAAILKENQELQEKLKQVGWRLPKSFDTNSKEFAEYPVRVSVLASVLSRELPKLTTSPRPYQAPAKRQKAFEVDEVPADRFQAPPPYEYMPPPYYNSMSMSYHHRPAVGISVNIQSPPWDMAVQHQSGEVRHAARSPAPPHFERRADVTLPPR
jgi:hypothetical protein